MSNFDRAFEELQFPRILQSNASLNAVDDPSACTSLNLSSHGLGSVLIASLNERFFKKNRNIIELDLSDNRLDDNAFEKIFTILLTHSPYLKIINVSENKIGHRGMTALARYVANPRSCLEKLVMTNNQFGDRCAGILGRALQKNKTVEVLHLNKNLIQTDKEIFKALVTLPISEFDISWNNIRSTAAVEFGERLKENKTLKVLNISFNAFGSSAKQSALIALSEAFKVHPTLYHVDLSHNMLNAADCEVLGEALKENHIIIGLHMEGNSAWTDSRGYIVLDHRARDPTLSHSLPSITQCSSPHGINAVKEDREKSGNCWICDQWSEVEFAVKLGSLGIKVKPGINVHFHPSFDDFVGEVMNKVSDEEFRTVRMVPPGKHHYVFTVDGSTFPLLDGHLNQAVVFTRPINVCLRSHASGLEPCPEPTDEMGSRVEGDDDRNAQLLPPGCIHPLLHLFGTSLDTLRICPPSPTSPKSPAFPPISPTSPAFPPISPKSPTDKGEHYRGRRDTFPKVVSSLAKNAVASHNASSSALTRSMLCMPAWASDAETKVGREFGEDESTMESWLLRANEIVVWPRQSPLSDITCQPRTSCLRESIRESWTFAKSIFASFQQDDEEHLRKCFDCDIQNGKLLKMIKSEEERDAVFSMLWGSYKTGLIPYAFRSCAGTDSTTIFVGWNVYTELMNNLGVPDQGTCKLKDLDTLFIAVNAGPISKEENNPQRLFTRFEFLESLVRVAELKYMRSKFCASLPEAVTIVLNDHFPKAKYHPAHAWRWNRLYSEAIDTAIKSNLSILKTVFRRFGSPKKLGAPPTLTVDEFNNFVEDLELITDEFTQREVSLCFTWSRQMLIDVNKLGQYNLMTFIEFIEALALIADFDIDDGNDGVIMMGTSDRPPLLPSLNALIAKIAAYLKKPNHKKR
eukprot:TRINITY_DN14985_c0_g1_i3.p1 TRINITY_DN14985_c0_g1~~TRINITY_DN14985_c0_g1_i3.p1  ORF type:complete len:916 (-),score=232.05 TRINITY_DN14985_c0_g1_i3:194-2941(-)